MGSFVDADQFPILGQQERNDLILGVRTIIKQIIDMSEKQRFTVLAQYNQWMNQKLYAACAELTEQDLHLDRKAFFASIYLTLNHIMYGDLAFLSRMTGDPDNVPDLGEEFAESFSELRQKREILDQRIIDWVATLDNEFFDQTLTYKSKIDGKRRQAEQGILLTHMFNHQTHHRGQITTLLSQMEIDIGPTDIPFMSRFIIE